MPKYAQQSAQRNNGFASLQNHPAARFTEQPSPTPLSRLGEDGVTHINIYNRGETNIGRALHHYEELPFEHSEYGPFKTVEGFWHWIKSVSQDDIFRSVAATKLSALARSHQMHEYVENFRVTIMDANWQKVCAYPDLAHDLKHSKLPFEQYYYWVNPNPVARQARPTDPQRIRPPTSTWVPPGFEEIRKALKENRAPDFSFLSDGNTKGVESLPYSILNPKKPTRVPVKGRGQTTVVQSVDEAPYQPVESTSMQDTQDQRQTPALLTPAPSVPVEPNEVVDVGDTTDLSISFVSEQAANNAEPTEKAIAPPTNPV